MHPLLSNWRRILLYLTGWIEFGVVLGLIVPASSGLRRPEAVAVVVPLMLVIGIVCLAPWYICRSVPLRGIGLRSVLQHHILGAVIATVVVTVIGRILASMLASPWPGLDNLFSKAIPVITIFVALTYMLSTSLHYAFLEIESSRRAEILAREAQLRALKAQINPHFLFNSLNSISALTSLDPARAREMCIGLADFLRASLRLGERDTVPFGEEIALTNMYLSVEKARFGDRLRLIRDIDSACESCEVPALIVQPLVENAVKHGIAMMAEGGEISIVSRCEHDQLRFSVSNPFDPEAPVQDRNGIGLRNVRARLEARYGAAAKMQIDATDSSYQVTLTIPAKSI
ncbi:MAG TPA: histidine kinase [Rhizomicrobium sp.]|nr:histidine kinase [Rhizomicrobium sp.]